MRIQIRDNHAGSTTLIRISFSEGEQFEKQIEAKRTSKNKLKQKEQSINAG
jgi:hypothetical protein